MGFYDDIVKFIKDEKPEKDALSRQKAKLSQKYNLKRIPSDIEILLRADIKDVEAIKRLLLTKPIRSMSGVTVCAIMAYPFRCPHGQCLMCPGKEGVPQSYTGKEPAAMRGIRNHFDSYLQVMNRLEQYICSGHSPDKMELIIMGGTFPSFDRRYQEEFVMYAFKAMNDFSRMFYRRSGGFDFIGFKKFFELPGEVGSAERTRRIHEKLLCIKGKSNLKKEQKKNETAGIRCIGLTIETRPDYSSLDHGNHMLELGATRVELGVQSLYDDVLVHIKRGHDLQASIDATRTLKDLGFKINYHIMPGLPGSNIERDKEMLKALFLDDRFRPDMLKIYPCMVIPGSELYNEWEKGSFQAMSTAQAARLIADWKPNVPAYCRIMRVQRDIPTDAVSAGVDLTNLRQIVQKQMVEKNIFCGCIRCREIGRNKPKGGVGIKTLEYTASGGDEFFIAAESGRALLGFCRMRFPSQCLRKEIIIGSALIRELHVYGEAAGIGRIGKIQHRGLGKKLLSKAESIAIKHGKRKMVIISGVGAREYYRKLGYVRQGPYMTKYLLRDSA